MRTSAKGRGGLVKCGHLRTGGRRGMKRGHFLRTSFMDDPKAAPLHNLAIYRAVYRSRGHNLYLRWWSSLSPPDKIPSILTVHDNHRASADWTAELALRKK